MNRQFADDLDTDLARGHVLEWAELYALDAISAEERTSIDAFLDETEPAIRATFADRARTCRETVTAAYATDRADPPADLFDRIVEKLPAAFGSESAVPTSPGPIGSGAASTDLGEPDAPQDELARKRASKNSMSSTASRWLVGAAAAVVLAVGGVTIAQNLQPTSVEQQVMQASDVRTEQLSVGGVGRADLAISGEENAAVVTLSGIPSPADGYVYQMWRIPADGSAPVSVGTMTGEDVAGTKVTELPDINGIVAVAITVEPTGGSATPTLPIVAEIPLGA